MSRFHVLASAICLLSAPALAQAPEPGCPELGLHVVHPDQAHVWTGLAAGLAPCTATGDGELSCPDAASARAAAEALAVSGLPDGSQVAIELAHETTPTASRPVYRPLLLGSEQAIDPVKFFVVDATFDPITGMPFVMLTLSGEGAAAMCTLTSAMTGQRLAIVLEGAVLTAPVIRSPICEGQVRVDPGAGELALNQAWVEQLTESLRAAVECAGGVAPGSP